MCVCGRTLHEGKIGEIDAHVRDDLGNVGGDERLALSREGAEDGASLPEMRFEAEAQNRRKTHRVEGGDDLLLGVVAGEERLRLGHDPGADVALGGAQTLDVAGVASAALLDVGDGEGGADESNEDEDREGAHRGRGWRSCVLWRLESSVGFV